MGWRRHCTETGACAAEHGISIPFHPTVWLISNVCVIQELNSDITPCIPAPTVILFLRSVADPEFFWSLDHNSCAHLYLD